MKGIILIIILMTFFNNIKITYSQANLEWIARYSGTLTGIDGASKILTDLNGFVYVTGTSNGTSNNSDFCTIKYSPSGNQQWLARYNGPANGIDIAHAICLDDSGNVIITGGSDGIGTGSDFTTIKYDSLGIQKWVARYSSIGNHRDAAYDMVIDHNGNLLVTGISYGNVGFGDYYTIKYNSSGSQIWSSSYTDGTPYSITVDNLNNVYVTGRSLGDFLTIKYNANGVQKWITIYNGPMNDNDAGEVVKVDSLGNVYVSGSSIGSMFYYDYATVKYDSIGEQQWVRRYEGSGHYMDQVDDMTIDKAGNVYVTGNSAESGQGYNMTTIKYNTKGDTVWKASYNSGSNDIAYGIVVDNQGNVYVTGESDGSGTNEDYATVKYNSFGIQQWVKRYDYSGQFGDYPQAIALDNNGSVLVTGQSNRDFLTVKYSQLTGEIINESNIPTKYILSQNYPNPFNPTTNLEFGISKFGFIAIKVYDILGNEVKTLINENKPPGRYEVTFNASNAKQGSDLPSGIYFYSLLIDGNTMDTKRMVLLK